MNSRYHSDLIAATLYAMQQRMPPPPKAWHGVIQSGSYDPQKSTVEVFVGVTGALSNNQVAADPEAPDEFGPLVVGPIPLLSHIGVQYAPIGGERVLLIHSESGFYAALYHGPDDSPQAPSGETWIQRNDPVNTPPAQQKQFLKFQNDGVTRVGGRVRIAAIAPKVVLGADDTTDPNQIVRKRDLQKAINDAIAQVQRAFNTMASECQGGPGVAAPEVGGVTAESSQTSFTI